MICQEKSREPIELKMPIKNEKKDVYPVNQAIGIFEYLDLSPFIKSE